MVAHLWDAPRKLGTSLGAVAQGPEKRLGGDRHKVMIPATIVCPDGTTYACVIRDMSITGAKLSVSRRHRLPPDFALAIPGRDVAYPVQRAWQVRDHAGVTLIATKPDAG